MNRHVLLEHLKQKALEAVTFQLEGEAKMVGHTEQRETSGWNCSMPQSRDKLFPVTTVSQWLRVEQSP